MRNHNIQYQWSNSARKLIRYNGSKHVSSPQEDLRLLHSWGIIKDPHAEEPANPSLGDMALLLFQAHYRSNLWEVTNIYDYPN